MNTGNTPDRKKTIATFLANRMLLAATTLFALIIFWDSVISCPEKILAQTGAAKVKKNEDVRVKMNNQWLDGIVIETKGKKILVEYDIDGKIQRGVFARAAVRLLCEGDAIDFCRRWRSAAGKSSVHAALKEIKGDSVVLVKRDLKKITVPLKKLSKPDNAYVKRMNKWFKKTGGTGRSLANLPEIEDFGGSVFDSSGTATFGTRSYATFGKTGESEDIHTFGSEPECYKYFEQSGVGFTMPRFFEKLRAVMPVGGKQQLVLASGQESLNTDKNPSTLYWLSFKKKKVVARTLISPSDIAIDYHPEKHLLLSYHEDTFRSGLPKHLTLWKLEPGSPIASPIVRFRAQIDSFFDHFYGRIIDEKTILVRSRTNNTYTCYDLENKEIAYEFRPESFFGARITLSPDRKHIISPEDGFISVYDSVTGEPTTRISTGGKRLAGARVNPDGTKLAAISSSEVFVWDLKKKSAKPEIYPAPLIGSPFTSRVEWVGNSHLLGEDTHNRVLYSLKLKLPVWTYKMNIRDGFTNRNPLKSLVANNLFFYVANPDISASRGNSFGVGAVELPGPKVMDVTRNASKTDLTMVKPGTRVRIDTSGVSSNQSQIYSWLTEKAEQNGWIIDDNAEVSLKGMMGTGSSQTVQYFVSDSLLDRNNGNWQSVTFTPHWSRIRLVKDGYILWQSGTTTGAPAIIRGRNIAQKVQSYQTPRLQFFKNVSVPKEILNPKYSRGFGVSSLGLRGIRVVSTNPPGRTKNPFETEKKEDERLRLQFEKDKEKERQQVASNQPGSTSADGSRIPSTDHESGPGGSMIPPGEGASEPPAGRVQEEEAAKRRRNGRGGFPPGGSRGGPGRGRGN